MRIHVGTLKTVSLCAPLVQLTTSFTLFIPTAEPSYTDIKYGFPSHQLGSTCQAVRNMEEVAEYFVITTDSTVANGIVPATVEDGLVTFHYCHYYGECKSRLFQYVVYVALKLNMSNYS